ncbi:MAG: hypothetical protein NVSMB45_18710 [Ginsengibacter sp.]
MTFYQRIQEFDYYVSSKVNGEWHTDFFDVVFLLMREAAVWLPLYVFLLVFIVMNFKKQGWIWGGFLGVTVVISNYISSNLIKDNIMRLRPCQDPALYGKIRALANYCPSSSSFTSSHATNHFTIAMFIYLTLRNIAGKWVAGFFLWAALISCAQVYVGVHFFTDVTGGAIAGIIIGYIAALIFNMKIGLGTTNYLQKT